MKVMSILLAVLFFLQSQYIHQLVQSRLFVEEDPLVDLYKCLRILYSTNWSWCKKHDLCNSLNSDLSLWGQMPFLAFSLIDYSAHYRKKQFFVCITLYCMVLNTYADSFCLSLQLQVLHFQVSLEFTCMFVLLSLSKHLINRPLLIIW